MNNKMIKTKKCTKIKTYSWLQYKNETVNCIKCRDSHNTLNDAAAKLLKKVSPFQKLKPFTSG